MEILEILRDILTVGTIPIFMALWADNRKKKNQYLEETAEIKEDMRRAERERNAERDGTMAILRNDMVSMHREFRERGSMDINQRESLIKTYEAYKGMGGNGMVDTLMEDLSPDKIPTTHPTVYK